MSARPPQCRAAAAVAVLLVAAVAPWVGAAGASAASGSFEENVVHVDKGDVVAITVRTSGGSGTVNLGSPDQGFWMQVDVGSGTTELRLNTYKAGMATSWGEMAAAIEGGTLKETKLTSVDGPLETAQYRMNVTVNGIRQANGAFIIDERSTNGISAAKAPKGTDIESLDPEDIEGATTPLADNGTVAREDWYVVHVDATGLNGVLSQNVLDGDRHGLKASFVETGTHMNVEPNAFTGDEVERFVADSDGEGFYLFVDTADHGIAAGDRYNVTFAVEGDSPLADEREAVSTSVRVVERRVNLQYDGDRMVVEGETAIRGRTTLTPGTTVNVTAEDEEIPPFHRSKTVTVGDEGTFAATFSFGDLERGREFQVHLRDQGQTHEAVVGPLPTTTTATPEPATETATPEPTTETATPEPTTTTETTAAGLTQVDRSGVSEPLTQRVVESGAGGVPGFGAGAAAVALAAAALLAVRRS